MDIVTIKTSDISLPKAVQAKEYPEQVIDEMAQEIRRYGWPKGKELGVKQIGNRYEVHASFAWFNAGLIASVENIPCVIY